MTSLTVTDLTQSDQENTSDTINERIKLKVFSESQRSNIEIASNKKKVRENGMEETSIETL